MNRNNGVRDEYIQEKNRRAMRVWDEMMPDGGFEDEPAAQSHDRNGRHINRQGSDYVPGGMDLGRFPPVE